MNLTNADLLALTVALIAVPLSALLAITDTVLTQVTRARVDALVEEHPDRRALRSLRTLLEKRDQALHPVLLVELVCDVVAAGLVAAVAYRVGGMVAMLVAFAVGMPLMYLAAASLPRAWALHNLDRAIAVAGPLGRLVAGLWPIRLLAELSLRLARRWFPPAPKGTLDELGDDSFVAVAGSPLEADRIDFDDHDLLASVIEFGRTVVREVMVPRPDMATLPGSLTLAEAVPLVQAEGYSRFPVTGESIDDVIGILYAKDVANAALGGATHLTVAALARPAWFVPELKTVSSLLREMQVAKLHVAVAVDEYGGTAGLISLEDIIEELVGDIEDEFDDARPGIERLADGSVRIEARMPLDEVNDQLDLDLPDGDWDTVGGLVFDHFGTIPTVGQVARFGEHTLEVAAMSGRRIARLVLRHAPLTDRGEVTGGAGAAGAGEPVDGEPTVELRRPSPDVAGSAPAGAAGAAVAEALDEVEA
ncbi:MAG: hemolysin family protein [Acidimicrobiia bacterium]